HRDRPQARGLSRLGARGAGPGGGHIGSMFMPVYVALPLAKDGQIRLLAVATSERGSVAPDLPQPFEEGIDGVDADFWLGMVASAATPPQTVERYNGVLNDILRMPGSPTGSMRRGS